LFEFVNLNHFRKNVPTLILDGRNVGNGDGFPSHHRPAGDYSEEAPTPPRTGLLLLGHRILELYASLRHCPRGQFNNAAGQVGVAGLAAARLAG
jgi:hypothetical protein